MLITCLRAPTMERNFSRYQKLGNSNVEITSSKLLWGCSSVTQFFRLFGNSYHVPGITTSTVHTLSIFLKVLLPPEHFYLEKLHVLQICDWM